MKKTKLRQIIREELKNKNFVLTEQEEEDGMKSSRGALDTKKIRIVIDGDDVKSKKDKILQLLKKHDPEHKVQYFEATEKLVGTFAQYKFDGLKRDLKGFNVEVIEKPLSKSLKKK